MTTPPDIEVKNLDHLGLIAGTIDSLGLVEILNKLVGEQPGEIVSPGQVVKAMILNGLGLVSAPLYLFSRFFEKKPTSYLIGEGIEAKHLNDDRLGRILDKLYVTGLTPTFTAVALAAVKKFKISTNTCHLDSSSFHVHGEYQTQTLDNSEPVSNCDIEPTQKPSPISITYGYSRDHRPDLKQFLVDLICTGDGDVPLFLRVADGNESDAAVFGKILSEFKNQLKFDSLMVADSALYTAENLGLMTNLKWLSRVPAKVKLAKSLISRLRSEDLTASTIQGYKFSEQKSNYGGIEQRWLVVESEARRQSDHKRLDKKIQQAEKEASQKLRQLSTQEFACKPDALAAANQLYRTFKYHQLTEIKLQEVSTKARSGQSFTVQAILEVDAEAIATQKRQSGRFVLATNQLEAEELSNDEMIAKYKEQQAAERGFAFLKDPLFFTDSVFLKTPERVEALAMVMGLCLLIYTLGQRQLRQRLKSTKSGLKNQLGKLTDRPTLRWIFQCFHSVHLVIVNQVEQICNLTSEQLEILRFFPEACQSYYLLKSG